MVYMHSKTFEIWTNAWIVALVEDYGDNWFEVDELIAPVIQSLNRNGYATAECCAGHLPQLDSQNIDRRTTQGPRSHNGIYICRSFIAFAKGVALPNLPDGFNTYYPGSSCGPGIMRRFMGKYASPYEFYAERLEAMRALYEWVQSLPNHK